MIEPKPARLLPIHIQAPPATSGKSLLERMLACEVAVNQCNLDKQAIAKDVEDAKLQRAVQADKAKAE